MKAKFSRLVPFYILAEDEADDSIGFDAYPVDVEPRTVAVCQALRKVAKEMNELFDNMPAPEEAAQQEALHFEEMITQVLFDAFD